MKRAGRVLTIIFSCAAMLMLILDSKTALQGAQEGLAICGKTVIPALFPFFVISILLTGAISGYSIPIFKPITKFCKMPKGSESLLLVGLLGGYPVGAKCIYDCWKSGQLTKEDARRCLGFCSNAGPAFIFGMCGILFEQIWTVWVLWGIHIFSALLVGNMLPGYSADSLKENQKENVPLTDAASKATTAMISVCGWVILFRVIIVFGERWFLWLLPEIFRVALQGILELANGCNSLLTVQSEGVRFLLCAAFLSFGGICVGLQTASVVGELGTGLYFPGKALQCVISCSIAGLFVSLRYRICSPVWPMVSIIVLFLLVALKKTVAFPGKLVYNEENY